VIDMRWLLVIGLVCGIIVAIVDASSGRPS
jgi:hypothetical protein